MTSQKNWLRKTYDSLHATGHYLFNHIEASVNRVFGERFNLFYFLGTIPIFLLLLLIFTGLYMFVYYSMAVDTTYESVKYITENAPLGQFFRSLHHYAADAMMFFVILHLLKVFVEGKYQNHRWLSWVSGIFLLTFVLTDGITGYMMSLDSTSHFVLEKTSEYLVGLKIFGHTLTRTFAAQSLMGKWIMWIILVIHFAIPLSFLFLIYIHVKRVSRAKIIPPKAMMIGIAAFLISFAVIFPIGMKEAADYGKIAFLDQINWFYLFIAPFMNGENWELKVFLGFSLSFLILLGVPWYRKRPVIDPADLDLDHCTGCSMCAQDCPYEAIQMQPRTDNHPKYKRESKVDPILCSGCGTCVGSCDYGAMNLSQLRIPLVQEKINEACSKGKPKETWLGIFCQSQFEALKKKDLLKQLPSLQPVVYPCVGIVGPSLIEKAIHSDAKGVIIGSCPENGCEYREGNIWLGKRLLGKRKPHFKKVDRQFPLALIRFNESGGEDFITTARDFMDKHSSKSMGEQAKRALSYVKQGKPFFHYSLSIITLSILLWLFYLGAVSPFGSIPLDTSKSLLRIDFSYETSYKSGGAIDPKEFQKEFKRITRFIKLDQLTHKQRERLTKMAKDNVKRKFSHGNKPLEIEVYVDKELKAKKSYQPSGIKRDGRIFVLHKEFIPPGKHKIVLKAYEIMGQKKAHPLKSFEISRDFEGGRVYFIDYSKAKSGFYIRTK